MRVSRALTAALAAVVVAACTGTDGGSARPTDPATPAATTPDDPPDTTTPTTPASPSPSDTAGTADDAIAFGTGTVTVDGTTMPVSGDCDVSRDFGEQPVRALDEEVDVVLAVDNIGGDGTHDGPFPVRVALTGDGAIGDRVLTSRGAATGDGSVVDMAYEGVVDVAELRDRRALDFVDAAVLHVEASQRRVGGGEAPAQRDLVVDVACSVSRPG